MAGVIAEGQVIAGDCRAVMPDRGPFDLIIADPPYGVTTLAWDKRVDGWLALAAAALKPSGSMWVFGSMRFFMAAGQEFANAGLKYAQDIVWEKQNGSGFAADRFRRVHEHVVQLYRADSPWAGVYNNVQRFKHTGPVKSVTAPASRTLHTGKVGAHTYVDDGTRIMRSVIEMPNLHRRGAIHPTEKPVALLEMLIRSSCPPGGKVGDWFAGSGAAGDAARRAGCRYEGCEIDAAMAAKANARLAALIFGG